MQESALPRASINAPTSTRPNGRLSWPFARLLACQPRVDQRTAGVRSETEGVRIRITFFDRDDGTKAAGPPAMTVPLTGENDRTATTPEFEVPERTGRVQVELRHWHAAGESWWREPRLERVAGAE